MAGVPKYTVVLDACVLYPAKLRNLLLCLAERGAFHARWTHDIQNEWVGSLLKKGKEGITEEKLQRRSHSISPIFRPKKLWMPIRSRSSIQMIF